MITGYLLKKPDSKRRTFQLLPYSRANGKKIYASPVDTPELAALNESLRQGTLTAAQCELEIKTKILPELKRRIGVKDKAQGESQVSENNLKVFKAFWTKEYRRKKLERPSTAYDEFITALRYFEPLSLHAADVDEIQDHWDKKLKGSRNKKYGNRINQLLTYLNRGFSIVTDRAVTPPLKWVTYDELQKILERVNNPVLRDLYEALYGTGARIGELFVISPEDVRDNGTIYISRQMTPTAELKPYTKNKKSHDTLILPEALPALKRWAAVKDKASYRKRAAHPLTEAAVATFPADREKQISPHKLRHSYVKQMMTLGVPIDRIALYLGDRISTIETTYRQWTVNDSEIDYVKSIMAEGYKRLAAKRK